MEIDPKHFFDGFIAAVGTGGDALRPFLLRAVEAGAMTLVVLYAADKVQTAEIEHIKAQIHEVQRRNEIADEKADLARRELLSRLEQMENRLYDVATEQPRKRLRKGD